GHRRGGPLGRRAGRVATTGPWWRVGRSQLPFRGPGRHDVAHLHRHASAPLDGGTAGARVSGARPRALSSWTCRTYSEGGGTRRGASMVLAIRSRNGAVAKKKRRPPTRLKWVNRGSTGRNVPSRTPCSTIRRTAPRTRTR